MVPKWLHQVALLFFTNLTLHVSYWKFMFEFRIFFQVSSSKINPERASKLYVCQFCPGSGFKWQSCLYKHWVFKHFNDEIRYDNNLLVIRSLFTLTFLLGSILLLTKFVCCSFNSRILWLIITNLSQRLEHWNVNLAGIWLPKF